MNVNLNLEEMNGFFRLGAQVGGIFGPDIYKKLKSTEESTEVKRIIALALGSKKNKAFLEKIKPEGRSFVGLCFGDICASIVDAFLER